MAIITVNFAFNFELYQQEFQAYVIRLDQTKLILKFVRYFVHEYLDLDC